MSRTAELGAVECRTELACTCLRKPAFHISSQPQVQGHPLRVFTLATVGVAKASHPGFEGNLWVHHWLGEGHSQGLPLRIRGSGTFQASEEACSDEGRQLSFAEEGDW